MNRRKRRQLELGVVALAYSALVLLVFVVYLGLRLAQIECAVTPTPPQHTNWRPDIRPCFGPEVPDLWNCIRNAEYSRQPEEEDVQHD